MDGYYVGSRFFYLVALVLYILMLVVVFEVINEHSVESTSLGPAWTSYLYLSFGILSSVVGMFLSFKSSMNRDDYGYSNKVVPSYRRR